MIEKGADSTIQDLDGMNSLHKAVEQNKESSIKLLLELSKDKEILLSAKDSKGKIPLDYASTESTISLLNRIKIEKAKS